MPTNFVRDPERWWARRFAPLPTLRHSRSPLRPQPLVEHLDIHKPARMAALAEPARALERLDLEADDAALDRDHLRGGPHRRADESGCEMADVDLGADSDPARLKRGARIASPDVISISRIIIGVA
ncbi:hypothetical protein ACVWXN_009895 [Bradyrhizobium sp. i1.4.4]